MFAKFCGWIFWRGFIKGIDFSFNDFTLLQSSQFSQRGTITTLGKDTKGLFLPQNSTFEQKRPEMKFVFKIYKHLSSAKKSCRFYLSVLFEI